MLRNPKVAVALALVALIGAIAIIVTTVQSM